MASRGFYDVTGNPSSPSRNSPHQSLSGTDSPSFYSPRSLSPDIETMQREEEVSIENAPLITHENHDENNQSELSMSIVFPGSSSNSFEAEDVPFWKHIR